MYTIITRSSPDLDLTPLSQTTRSMHLSIPKKSLTNIREKSRKRDGFENISYHEKPKSCYAECGQFFKKGFTGELPICWKVLVQIRVRPSDDAYLYQYFESSLKSYIFGFSVKFPIFMRLFGALILSLGWVTSTHAQHDHRHRVTFFSRNWGGRRSSQPSISASFAPNHTLSIDLESGKKGL